jgi:hypothetical protein
MIKNVAGVIHSCICTIRRMQRSRNPLPPLLQKKKGRGLRYHSYICMWMKKIVPQTVRVFSCARKYTTFSTDRIVAFRSVNIILKSYDFAANIPIHNFPYVEINVRMTSILVSSFSKLYPESNAHNAEPIVIISGTKSWDFFHATFNNCIFNFGQ